MPVIINKIGNHRNEEALPYLIHYMSTSCYAKYCGGRGIVIGDYEAAILGFRMVKNFFDKDDRKQVAHIIIGTNEKDGLIIDNIIEIAEYTSKYFYQKGFQSYYVIHCGSDENPNYTHIHFAVNTINFNNGIRFYETYGNTYKLQKALEAEFQNSKWFSVNDSSQIWEE